MAENTATCRGCKHTFTLRVMRYTKINGEWVYLCKECRKAKGLPDK